MLLEDCAPRRPRTGRRPDILFFDIELVERLADDAAQAVLVIELGGSHPLTPCRCVTLASRGAIFNLGAEACLRLPYAGP